MNIKNNEIKLTTDSAKGADVSVAEATVIADTVKKYAEQRIEREKRITADIISWILGCAVIGLAVGIAYSMGGIPAWLAIVVSSVVSLTAGIRVGGLIRAI